jgi:hypothetical protein
VAKVGGCPYVELEAIGHLLPVLLLRPRFPYQVSGGHLWSMWRSASDNFGKYAYLCMQMYTFELYIDMFICIQEGRKTWLSCVCSCTLWTTTKSQSEMRNCRVIDTTKAIHAHVKGWTLCVHSEIRQAHRLIIANRFIEFATNFALRQCLPLLSWSIRILGFTLICLCSTRHRHVQTRHVSCFNSWGGISSVWWRLVLVSVVNSYRSVPKGAEV